jgi:hypothetical protein
MRSGRSPRSWLVFRLFYLFVFHPSLPGALSLKDATGMQIGHLPANAQPGNGMSHDSGAMQAFVDKLHLVRQLILIHQASTYECVRQG